MTNTALKAKGLVSQTQVSAKVCETWFGRVIAPLGTAQPYEKWKREGKEGVNVSQI